jgi:hypothetical protein
MIMIALARSKFNAGSSFTRVVLWVVEVGLCVQGVCIPGIGVFEVVIGYV